MTARQLTVHWVCGFVVFGAFFLGAPVLWDLDSYDHLAVARLALMAFAFASGYTAFHVFVALVFAWQGWLWLTPRRFDFRMAGRAIAGTAAGLFIRPSPIENLRLW